MPKLPVVSGRELIAILLRLGFEVKRQRGSHVSLHHRDGRACVVPLHRQVKTGTLAAILRQAQLGADDIRLET